MSEFERDLARDMERLPFRIRFRIQGLRIALHDWRRNRSEAR